MRPIIPGESPVMAKTISVERVGGAQKLVALTTYTNGHKSRETLGGYCGVIILPDHWKSPTNANALLAEMQMHSGRKESLEILDAQGATRVDGIPVSVPEGMLAFYVISREAHPVPDLSRFKPSPDLLTQGKVPGTFSPNPDLVGLATGKTA